MGLFAARAADPNGTALLQVPLVGCVARREREGTGRSCPEHGSDLLWTAMSNAVFLPGPAPANVICASCNGFSCYPQPWNLEP
eukprot:322159-Chlamydomonas_euryale.AAC.2